MHSSNSEYQQVLELRDALVSKATDGHVEDDRYQDLRRALLDEPAVKTRLPDFVQRCRTVSEFWGFIKHKFDTYKERREFLWEEFESVLDYLEFSGSTPADEEVETSLAELDPEHHVLQLWQRAVERRQEDPEGAITLAKSMLESVCKHLLDDVEGSYPDSADLPDLYHQTSKALELHPQQYDEEVFKKILGATHTIVGRLGKFRNDAGDAHGRGPYHLKPQSRHSELAVNTAGAVASYLVRTWKARNAAD